ncbi:MAG TPA: DPP IV N-terminal domain-containing protein, partial [Pyrinomonadaceae bacterium]|nr:DPP IV N-terminal domain-containing protein [Pyrinomonadaceae bacterium]
MITGIRPFTGETTSDVLAAILRSHPPDMEPYGVPIELEHIVSKALRKDRDERYQNIRDMLIDLKDLARELDLESRSGRVSLRNTGGRGLAPSTAEISQQPVSTAEVLGPATHSISDLVISQFRLHPKGMTASVAMLIVALASGVVGFKLWYDRPAAAHSFEKMQMAKLASFGNSESTEIAVSPDGKYVVYVIRNGTKQGLWVRHVATSSNVAVVPDSDVEYGYVTFSKDGDHIYFSQRENRASKGEFSIYKVAVLGGGIRKIISDSGGPISFSPDGSRIVYNRREKTVLTADADGSNETVLAETPSGQTWSDLAWSPEGGDIVAAGFTAADSQVHLFRISARDGSFEAMNTPPWLSISGIVFAPDGKGFYVSGRDNEVQRAQIWHVSYPDGSRSRITNDLSSYERVSISADGRSIASVQTNRSANLFVRDTNGADIQRKVTSDIGKDNGISGIAWVPDGRIVYTARTVGVPDIWIVDEDGNNPRQLTSESGKNYLPTVSPDGKKIAFVSDRTGNVELWTMNIDGSNPIRMTTSEGMEGLSEFTPDGNWLVYEVIAGNDTTSIWKIPAVGGEPIPLTTTDSMGPKVSPDGQYLACKYKERSSDLRFNIALIPLGNVSDHRILNLPDVANARSFSWNSDGTGFVYTGDPLIGSGGDLRLQSLKGNEPILLSSPDNDRI